MASSAPEPLDNAVGAENAHEPVDITRRGLNCGLSLRSRLRNRVIATNTPHAVTAGAAPDSLVGVHAALPPNTFKCLLVGPSGAGKTSLVMRLKFGNFVDVAVPTIGCNIAITPTTRPGFQICLWDMGNGLDGSAELHAEAVRGIDALVFMVDAEAFLGAHDGADPPECRAAQYRESARSTLWTYIRKPAVKKAIVLVLGSHADRISGKKGEGDAAQRISDTLALHHVGCCHVAVRLCSVVTGTNFDDSIYWLTNAILGLRSMLNLGALKRPVPSGSRASHKSVPRTPPPLMRRRGSEQMNALSPPNSLSLPSLSAIEDQLAHPHPLEGKNAVSPGKWSANYINANVPAGVFRQHLRDGTLARFDFQDATRIVFCLATEVLFEPEKFASFPADHISEIPLDCVDRKSCVFYSLMFWRLHKEVSVLFRLPGSILSNATATRILIDAVVSAIQMFLIAHRRSPHDSEFCQRILGIHHCYLATSESTIWKAATTELLFSNAAADYVLEPDLCDAPLLWCIPVLTGSPRKLIDVYDDFNPPKYGISNQTVVEIQHIDFLSACYVAVVSNRVEYTQNPSCDSTDLQLAPNAAAAEDDDDGNNNNKSNKKNETIQEPHLKSVVGVHTHLHDKVFQGRASWTAIILCTHLLEVAVMFNEDANSGKLSFANFAILFPALAHSAYWHKHYTETFWKKARVSDEFVTPDKLPVPNAFTAEEARRASSIPTMQRLVNRLLPRKYDVSSARERLYPVAPANISHVDFLFTIYDHLAAAHGDNSADQIVEDKNGVENSKSGSLGPPAVATMQLAAMLCALYEPFPHQTESARVRPTNVPTGMTHVYFWVCIVSVALAHTVRMRVEMVMTAMTMTTTTVSHEDAFDLFLRTYPALLWPDLWSRYYTIECMWGTQGLVYCLDPDVCSIAPLHKQTPKWALQEQRPTTMATSVQPSIGRNEHLMQPLPESPACPALTPTSTSTSTLTPKP